MSDSEYRHDLAATAAPSPDTDEKTDSIETSAPKPRSWGWFADPLVRRMAWVGGIALVAFLAIVASALVLGVINPPAPRTALERDLALAQIQVEDGSADPAVWFDYVAALVLAGQHSKAERVLSDWAEWGFEDPAKQYRLVAQVRLDLAEERYEDVLENSDAAITALQKQLEIEKEQHEATDEPTTMIAEGLGRNYEILLLNRAEAFEALGRTDEAIESLDEYLVLNKLAADILVWRGDLRAATGDPEGAISDYESALPFSPGDEELVRKLSELGARDE